MYKTTTLDSGFQSVDNAISNARSCVVLVGTGLSQRLGLSDITSDSSVQAFLDPSGQAAKEGCDQEAVATEADRVYSAISGFCGSLARAPQSSVRELVEFLVSSDKLMRLYTDDVHVAPLKPVHSADQEQALDLRTVFVRGCVSKFVCMTCTAKNPLTQAVLFKSMSSKEVVCEVCGAKGLMARHGGDPDGAFIADICNAKENAQIASDLADIDAGARADLLLVIGAADDGASGDWAAIASKLSLSAAQTVVVSVSGALPSGIADTQSTVVVQCDAESFGSLWSDRTAATSADHVPHKGKMPGANGSRSTANSSDAAAFRMADLSLAESSSAAESSDERSQSQSSMSTSRSSAKRQGKGAKGRNKEKVNLNHLLNFTLPVRMPSPLPVVRPRRRVVDGVSSEKQAQVNKRTFINANFRFALKPRFWLNFMPIATRPDMQLKWEWIERVIMPVTGETVSCPICLSPPVAARVTKCGHVFCFPCVLRYLSMDSEKGADTKKCPICWEPIAGDDLLPVHFWTARYQSKIADGSASSSAEPMRHGPKDASDESSGLHAGTRVTMRLMKRLRGSTICLPRSTATLLFANGLGEHTKARDDGEKANSKLTFESYHFPWTFTKGALPFAKFMLADHEYCKGEYGRELVELEREKEEAAADIESQVFVESAIMHVEYAVKSAQTASPDDQQLESRARERQQRRPELKETSDAPAASSSIHPESNGTTTSTSAEEPHADDFFYFYQADDGQHIYMHPLHMRVLSHEYGSYAGLPDELEIRLRHSVESTITDEVRHRFRFLDHLSLRCDVIFVEPELKGLVSSKSADKFRSQLSHREKQHAARARHVALDEARSEALAAAAEAASASSGGIRYRSEWTRGGHDRFGEFLPASAYSGGKPDESSFPALSDSGASQRDSGAATPSNGNSNAAAAQPSSALWPRQPLPPSAASMVYNDIWEEFERSATGQADHEHGLDHYDGQDYDDEYYHINHSQGLDAKPGQLKIQTGKHKKDKSRIKLVLSGSSARRRR